MSKRTKFVIKNISILVIAIIATILLVKTLYVGFELTMCSKEIVDTEYLAQEYSYIPELRAEANAVYENVTRIRNGLYNSSDAYISWISTVDNHVSILVGIMLIIVVAMSYRYIYRRWCYVNSRYAGK
jgi:hypothetical protein